ncbi:MAG: hypothetical protein IPO78_05195 [Saprospiraceae bacterium]|nr:hypothetical protein [Saprospiraceae bacterium]MBK9720999.1 hypothetical protein [Saprospiraceae bacterium]
MRNLFSKPSLIVFIALCSFIFLFRISHVNKNEMSWDVLGYYLYLPASFIYDQPMLDDISWIQKINEEKKLTGTFYQISSNAKGEPMYFFLMGMAFFYLPFFLLGHGSAAILGQAMDGFSNPYQYCLVLGGIIYTIIGLFFLRKIVRHYFSELISSLILILIVLATNYIHHLTLDNLATVNVLFMLMSILVWNTIQWHQTQNKYQLITIGICVFLMGMVKPSEIIVFILPLLWGISSRETFHAKIQLIKAHWQTIFLCLGICLVLALPQMLYWHAKTGKWIYDSYKNPGVGLDIFSPHILETLFSYRKGWLLYTPIMIFSLIGFYFLRKNNKPIFYAILIYFTITFYIISSWSEWWYGAAYSMRPLITSYPLLAICMGYFLEFISKQRFFWKSLTGLFIIFFIFLNQFQWWQLRNYILDPYRTTKAYYWSIFLKTKPDASTAKLKRVERDFSGGFEFKNREEYIKKECGNWTFDDANDSSYIQDSTGNYIYNLTPNQEFSKAYEFLFHQLTSKDHVWLEAQVDVRFPELIEGENPLLVMSVENKLGIYGYHTIELKNESKDNKWQHYKMVYLTSEIRNTKDRVKCYIWNRGKVSFEIDNFKLDQYEPKGF